MAKRRKKTKLSTNTLRIIGGQWRSRKLSFTDAEDLRPTPDRIRETLFNWLQNDIHGALCLDLFAGSGALGLEALSRGASHVTFIEKDRIAANQLKTNLEQLKIAESKAVVHQRDALEYLLDLSETAQTGGGAFHIIFLDPPYRKSLLGKSIKLLKEKSLLKDDTLIYLEQESEEVFDWSDYDLEILKQSGAGQVMCYLLKPKS